MNKETKLPEEQFPVGAKVYAILRGGKEDGQIVEAEVSGYDRRSDLFGVIWERDDGMAAIEQIPQEDISKTKPTTLITA